MPQQIQPGTGQQDQSTAMQSAYNASQNAQGQGLGQGQATYNASQNVYGQANPQTATTMNQQQNPQQKVDAFIKEAGAAGKTFSPEEQKSMLENATKSFENEQAFRKNSPPQQSYGGTNPQPGGTQQDQASAMQAAYNAFQNAQGQAQGQPSQRSGNPFYTPGSQQFASPFRANQAYGVQNSGSLSGGGKGTTNAMASPKADFSNPAINRAATVPVPKTEEVKDTTKDTVAAPTPDPLAPARTDENGTYNSSGQRLNKNDDGTYSPYYAANENARGGAIKGQNSDKYVKKLTKSELDRIMSALAMALHVVNNRKE
jgi:hypothetical protein